MTEVLLSKSCLVVLDRLAEEGPLSSIEISESSKLARRTVNFAIRRLCKHKICRAVPDFQDMRSQKYVANPERLHEISAIRDNWRTLNRLHLKIA